MIFKKETKTKYRMVETDVKDFIPKLEKLIQPEEEEREIKVLYTPEMLFKFKLKNNVITLGCTDIMSDEEIDPDNATLEDVLEIISNRIKGLSVYKDANCIWIHEINVLVFTMADEDGNLVLDENGEKIISKQLEVFGFIKMNNDPLFEHMENEEELNARQKKERTEMIKKLEDMLHASKRRI